MPVQSADQTQLFSGHGTGTLRLVVFLAIAAALMASDARFGLLGTARHYGAELTRPVYWLASAPKRLGQATVDYAEDRATLLNENRSLREQILLSEAKVARFDTLVSENESLRTLLDARQRLGLKAQLVEIIDIDLDPFRQRLVVNRGTNAGISAGQAVLDGRGLIGQIVDASEHSATVILLTDPGHAVPVRVERTGLRSIAYGTGAADRLLLSHVPFSANLQPGDRLLSSGLGGRFPAGLPVAVITDVKGDRSATFAVAEAKPVAGIEQVKQLLVLEEELSAISADSVESAPDFVGPPQGLAFPPAQSP
ncbi:MAG: rod shape-determining protein MreC [Ahniella sp.]|nr:rod shape-determining protein MreC [Ahniella sp.]